VIVKYISFPSWFRYGGAAFYPFVFIDKMLKGKPDSVLDPIINHESIHIAQQKELFVIGFYILYLLEFIAGTIACGDSRLAYFSISFEQEAYEHQKDLSYLDKRKPMSWVKYFFETV